MRTTCGLIRAGGLSVVVAILAGCASGTGSQGVVSDVSGDFAGVETFLTVEPATLGPGDEAEIVFSVTNLNDRKIRIEFTDFRQLGLVVYDAIGDVFAVDDRTLTAPTCLSLGPFETWRREITWDGRVHIGRQRQVLDPGRYELEVGLRPYGDLLLNRSARVAIEILRDER